MEKNTITIKLDLDIDEAKEKLEDYKKQLQEVLELQNKLNIKEEKQNLPNISVKFGKVENHCVDIFTKLEDLAKPVSKFIIEKYGKHATAIITDETVKIVIDDISTPIRND